MDKRQYFIEALQAGCYKYREWCISVFTAVKLNPKRTMRGNEIDYPYQLVHKEEEKTVYFKDPNKNGELTAITGSDKTINLFGIKDRITLEPFELANVTETTETTFGNVLFNAIVLVYPFGNKIPFMKGRLKGSKIDDIVVKLLTDYPPEGQERDPKKIYLDEYKKYAKAAAGLAGLAQLCTPAASPKTMVINPAIIHLRDQLLEKHKHELKDPAVLAMIEAQLTKMDREDFINDPGGGFLIKDKNFDIIRKRAFIMLGAEMGFNEDKGGVEPIVKSLEEGIDVTNLPAMANNLRFGSYSRGHETALGGESVKHFYRVFQNTTIIEEDCGSTSGIYWTISNDNLERLIGMHQGGLSKNGEKIPADVTRLTEEKLKGLRGTRILVRSPMMCRTEAPSYCARCMGDTLAINPTGVHVAASDIGSTFLGTFMLAMHGKALRTTKFEIDADVL